MTVSVVCITYNQEKYIAEAIESFLMQETNFDYEILIHDDASTDATPEIIRQYEEAHPDLIKPVYQKENQYSKGIHVLDFYKSYAKGKYIAICEGDDYWTDPNKLQKQVDYMEAHQDCSACVHAACLVDAKTHKTVGKVRPSLRSRDYTPEEVILGGGGLFATNSIMYARAFSKRPEFFYNCSIGDFPLMIHLALSGRLHYMDACMSAYRIGGDNSWTAKMSKASIEIKKKHMDRIENMLKEVDEYTKKEYNDIIEQKIKKNRFNFLISIGDFEAAKSEFYRDEYKALGQYERFKIRLRLSFKRFIMSSKTIKRKYEE